jgi:hypothetical protein
MLCRLHLVWFDLLSSNVHDSDGGQLHLPSQLHPVWIYLLADHQLDQFGHTGLLLLYGLHLDWLHLLSSVDCSRHASVFVPTWRDPHRDHVQILVDHRYQPRCQLHMPRFRCFDCDFSIKWNNNILLLR